MKISGNSKFFLKVSYVFLIVSMFLPFAFGSTSLIVRYLWNADYEGPFLSPSYRNWCFYWSFLYVRESVPTFHVPSSMLIPPDPIFVGTRIGFLPEMWGWNTPLLHSILPLQIVLLVLGFFTVNKARKLLSVVPFFLGLIALLALYYFTTVYQAFGTPSFSFWVLVVAVLFTSIVLARTKKQA